MNGIWAIVLAAGESKRMGSPKMLLPWMGMTIIEQVVENVLASDVSGAVLVLGAGSCGIKNITSRYNVVHCYNEQYQSGMLSSVRCGFAALPDDCTAVVVMPGDQPMIEAGEINRVLAARMESGKGIVVPVYRGRRGHPLLIDSRYREEVMSLPENEGLRVLAARYPGDLFEAETDDPSVLRDIDTQEDYLNGLNIINKRWKRRSVSN
ncbi:MAG: nucleotidyltransferase family protein [Bacteroidales bacterium]|nr:nucleotidyltransferase family protein [Bacteroidales bacterium]